ncbi:MAG: alpha-mannosidase, partial [Cyanobacteriota bacterium]|nr:alpha-mannosidase [Cyanobacteriota bacterium]
MSQGPERASWDLLSLWQCTQPHGGVGPALAHPWGARHRPDWHQRGLVIWPRGGQWRQLFLLLVCPEPWQPMARAARARLCLRWWADQVELLADGQRIHQGDLFDPACRWPLPQAWWRDRPLQLELRLRSPLHDDGALIQSRLELEPLDPADPLDLLAPVRRELRQLAAGLAAEGPQSRTAGRVQVLGHAHLDLAWLWPVADTWQAAERTFASALALMDRFSELHFAHSTPALYGWLEQHRPALFARLQAAVAAGRFEPINGPWVESDCVLIATPSLLRQFQHGQHESRRLFPQLEHRLAWLPDSFGFGAGLPAVAAATGVRWFCTHKLAWNASNPFPHRLFRWRSLGGAELLALVSAPIGTDGDPLAMERYRQQWQAVSGIDSALWLPGVGDHGGGPTAEMLQQLALWREQPVACPQQHGTLRDYLAGLEPLAAQLPVWRDELYLELHRGCATTRPDQKRHNRSLERLLREADLAASLVVLAGCPPDDSSDWTPLLFQQFHDILPGTSIPEVFEQAEPQWRQARRRAAQQRDRDLNRWLGGRTPQSTAAEPWWLVQLQAQPAALRTLRLPPGHWQLAGNPQVLPAQQAPGGGVWLQLPLGSGIGAAPLERLPGSASSSGTVTNPVVLQPRGEGWWLENGQLRVQLGPRGVEQIWGSDGVPRLSDPLEWRRWR